VEHFLGRFILFLFRFIFLIWHDKLWAGPRFFLSVITSRADADSVMDTDDNGGAPLPLSFDLFSTAVGPDKRNPGMAYTEGVRQGVLLDQNFPLPGSYSSYPKVRGRTEDGGVNGRGDFLQIPSVVVDRLDRMDAVLDSLVKKQKRSDGERSAMRKGEVVRKRGRRSESSVQHGRESSVRDRRVRFVLSEKDGCRRIVDGRGRLRPSLIDLWFGGITVCSRGRRKVR